MSEAAGTEIVPERKRAKWPLLVGALLAVILGAGGFYMTFGGHLFAPAPKASGPEPIPDIAFVAIEPMVISLGRGSGSRHLRFRGDLEVARPHEAEVRLLMPRILDVLNGYLRAVEIRDLEDPPVLVQLRAQMLRRVQIVTGEGRVRDLLITEFVVN